MKLNSLLILASALVIAGCGTAQTDTYVSEESGLNLTKLTDETSTQLPGPGLTNVTKANLPTASFCGNRKCAIFWNADRDLAISPDGKELGFLSIQNKQCNVYLKNTATNSSMTQRTFRNVGDFCWGNDDVIYYQDITENSSYPISAVKAHAGNAVRQCTSSNTDMSPALSSDGSILYFARLDRMGPSVWCLNMKTNAISSCAKGFCPAPVPGSNDSFVCVRNTTNGNSELWLVDYVNGQETLILSDKERSFGTPSISPDGEWILCEGNAKSSISKRENLDIFAVRMDGSQLTRLTYHPAHDYCAVWSKDGNSIYFLSNRANKKDKYNIWKMNFAY